MTSSTEPKRQRLTGTIVSTKMAKTVVVEVTRYMKHPKYGKFVKKSKKIKAHDPEGKGVLGARATIEACAPVSKDKRFKLV